VVDAAQGSPAPGKGVRPLQQRNVGPLLAQHRILGQHRHIARASHEMRQCFRPDRPQPHPSLPKALWPRERQDPPSLSHWASAVRSDALTTLPAAQPLLGERHHARKAADPRALPSRVPVHAAPVSSPGVTIARGMSRFTTQGFSAGTQLGKHVSD
jgi:hypothetical protein